MKRVALERDAYSWLWGGVLANATFALFGCTMLIGLNLWIPFYLIDHNAVVIAMLWAFLSGIVTQPFAEDVVETIAVIVISRWCNKRHIDPFDWLSEQLLLYDQMKPSVRFWATRLPVMWRKKLPT